MHRIKTVTVLATLLLLMVLFTGCVDSEKGVDAIQRTAQEINDSSTLPMALLMSKSDADKSGYEEYIPNFTSFDYYGKDFISSFFRFPTDKDDFFLTDITWTGTEYDLFGVKIGDDHVQAVDTFKSWGYVYTDDGYFQIFEKDGIILKLKGREMIAEISIHIPTEFINRSLY